MAKTSLDNELLEELTTLRAEIEGLEGAYANAGDEIEKAKKKLATAETTREESGKALEEKRGAWDKAIEQLPEKLRGLLSVPQIRAVIGPKSAGPKSAGKPGKTETENWLREKLAKGPKSKDELVSAYKADGKGERIRFKTYVDSGLLKEKGGKYELSK